LEARGLSVMAQDDTYPVAILELIELGLLACLHCRGPHEPDRPRGHALERRRRCRPRWLDPLIRNLAADSNGEAAGVEAVEVFDSRTPPAGALDRFGHVPPGGSDHPHAGDDAASPVSCLG